MMRSVSDLLISVKEGKLSVHKAESLLRLDAVAIVGDLARIDYNRFLRRGVPEIIYSQSKTSKQLLAIAKKLTTKKVHHSLPIILSKVDQNQVKDLAKYESVFKRRGFKMRYFEEARMVAITHPSEPMKGRGRVALLAAGTSDIHALNETEVLLTLLGCRSIRFNDVGVAALHRLSDPLKKIIKFDPDVIVVAAGMEGALPSLVAGLSDVPVIGLPTSIGYGFGRGGESALMSMLQACPLGVCVVNIDAGIAAGIVAWLIARRSSRNSH